MLSRTKIVGMSVGASIGMIALIFILGGVSIGYYALYAPMRKNVERRVFEQTQSYTHGKIQDLAKIKYSLIKINLLNI